jgi:uncharacterized membrane protein YoaK (UPF0700 family)
MSGTPTDGRGWFRTGVRDYVAHPQHGSLPALLLLLTVTSGLVDAVSILSLGRVFVSNMTGNIVFIGFAAAGAGGFSLGASLFALAGFVAGAYVTGSVISRYGDNRAVLLRDTTAAQTLLLLVATVICFLSSKPLLGTSPVIIAILCAFAFGVQNATVRRLAVPDLVTTVVTMDLIGAVADRNRDRKALRRRALAIVVLFLGALLGASMVLSVGPGWPLALATAVTGVVAVLTAAALRRSAPWMTYKR